jgi:type VI secretion system protein ImpK
VNTNDPFGDYIDDDKTIVRPNPGGRRTSSADLSTVELKVSGSVTGIPELLHSQISQTSGNPLTGNAIALLSLASQLRNTVSHPDVSGLRNSVINEIKRFETNLKNQNVSTEQIQATRYALCSLLDEAVLNTPWGGNSVWSTQSLLITFHKEAWGGEKFFLILKNAMQQPGIHFHLLEFLYFCLCLGFEGKYRIQEHGATKLEEVRENLFQIIQRQRGDSDRELSIQWQGIKDQRHVLAKFVPLWVIALISAVVLMLIYFGFLFAINSSSGLLLGKLYGIKDHLSSAQTINSTAPANIAFSELQGFLVPEVQRGEVSLEQKQGKTIIRIISPELFASGSAQIVGQYYPLLNKISMALAKVSNRIVVAGHTDNVPIFSARFPSNWDLSKARAENVATMLSNNPQLQAVIIAEGRADSQPLVANDTAAHKAINRRVEIIF